MRLGLILTFPSRLGILMSLLGFPQPAKTVEILETFDSQNGESLGGGGSV